MLCGDFLAFMVEGNASFMHVVTKNVSGSTVVDWLRTLAPVRFTDPQTQASLNDLFSRIDQLRAQRNAYVHGIWAAGREPATAMVMTIRWERAEVLRDELVTPEDLSALLEEIHDVYRELVFLGDKLGFHPLPKQSS
jgi:hypothetical protein